MWVEVFAVFVVCHLIGDFALQTEWQACHKGHGLGADPTARRALLAHVGVYTLVFVPAFVWLGDDVGGLVAALAAILFATHLIVDDGRLLQAYTRRVKRVDLREQPAVRLAVDQTFHLVLLFGLALLAVA
jgi:hypothetical protein